MENKWCEAFESLDEAQAKYPSKKCESCACNSYNYNSGITCCEKIEFSIMQKIHENENK